MAAHLPGPDGTGTAPGTAEEGADTASLAEAMRRLPVGVMLFGPRRDRRGSEPLRFVNDAMLHGLGIDGAQMPSGTPLEFLVRCFAGMGLYGPGTPESLASSELGQDPAHPSRRLIRTTDGRVAVVSAVPMADGGTLVTSTPLAPEDRDRVMGAERGFLLAGLLDQLQTAFALYGPDRRLLAFNRAYPGLLDTPAEHVREGMSFEEVMPRAVLGPNGSRIEGDVSAFIAERAAMDRRGAASTTWRRLDGRDIRSISLPLSGGHWMLELDDVTELRAAEGETRRRTALLDGVMTALPHGVSVFDAQDRVAMFNAAYARIRSDSPLRLGESVEAVLRRRMAGGEYPGQSYAAVHAEYRRRAETASQTMCQLADGTALDITTTPLPDGGHISVLTDVSARHRAEAELRRSATTVRVMLDNLRHGVALFDDEHRLVTSNALAARLTGLDGAFRPGLGLRELHALQVARGEIGPEENVRVLADGLLARKDRYTRQRPDGTVLEVTTDPIPGGGYVRVYADITGEHRSREAIERARDAAEAASRAKSRFLASMSHELRTPLNAVIGFSEALMGPVPPGPEQVQEFAATIHEAGRHLLSLINDILDANRAETAGPRITPGRVPLGRVLAGAARLMGDAAERGGLRLVVDLPADLPVATADGQRLRQVLLNLLGNAVKFTLPGGTVRLSAGPVPGGGLEIRVADTGIGMDPARIPQAFEAFTQLETGPSRRFGGSGLGLTLALAMSEAMGMRLGLDSAPGAGTTARLFLPSELLEPTT